MSENLMFQEYQADPRYRPKRLPFMVRFLIEHSGGRVTDETQANTLLILGAVAAIIVALILFHFGTKPPTEAPRGYQGNVPHTPAYRAYFPSDE